MRPCNFGAFRGCLRERAGGPDFNISRDGPRARAPADTEHPHAAAFADQQRPDRAVVIGGREALLLDHDVREAVRDELTNVAPAVVIQFRPPQ